MIKFVFIACAILLSRPPLAFAAPSCGDSPICSFQDIVNLISALVEQFQVIFWIVAAGSGLYAAFLYIRSGGKPEMLKSAYNQIIYTVVAIVLGILAFGLPALIDSFLRLR